MWAEKAPLLHLSAPANRYFGSQKDYILPLCDVTISCDSGRASMQRPDTDPKKIGLNLQILDKQYPSLTSGF